jgi:RimJ/RimL family protein N-acetyltransferase
MLTTPRLVLREMTSADIDDMTALLGDPEVMRYYPAPKTRNEARRGSTGISGSTTSAGSASGRLPSASGASSTPQVSDRIG